MSEEESNSISTRTQSQLQQQLPIVTLEQANNILQNSSNSSNSSDFDGSEDGDIEHTTEQYNEGAVMIACFYRAEYESRRFVTADQKT